MAGARTGVESPSARVAPVRDPYRNQARLYAGERAGARGRIVEGRPCFKTTRRALAPLCERRNDCGALPPVWPPAPGTAPSHGTHPTPVDGARESKNAEKRQNTPIIAQRPLATRSHPTGRTRPTLRRATVLIKRRWRARESRKTPKYA